VVILVSCNEKQHYIPHDFSKVDIDIILKDSIRVRAIQVYQDTLLGFGCNKGYGFINLKTKQQRLVYFNEEDTSKVNWHAEQRAVSFAGQAFYSLGIGSPARLRKVDFLNTIEKIVYTENHQKSFYDAMAFWNETEGIAMGDPTDNCLSVIITRDDGETWNKVSCDILPKTIEGEAAFAASNGNIAIVDDHTWIISGGKASRVFYSPDKGNSWKVFDTPLLQGTTAGGYSIHFYNKDIGVIYGGDYTKPAKNKANKAITYDRGKTWQLLADGAEPGYKSCVRFIPNSGGKAIIAVGFTGMSISSDYGKHWKTISKEGFYTLRFLNDSTAIAGGDGRIAKLRFKE